MGGVDFRRWLARGVPRRCTLCGARGVDTCLCPECLEDLPPAPSPRFPRCAAPSPTGSICGRCLASPPQFDATFVACSYAFPVDALIRALKYRHALDAAGALAEALAPALRAAPMPDLIVPVPLSASRERQRGFNQAVEIARCLPFGGPSRRDPAALVRARETPPQAALALSERTRNVRDAFRATRALDGLSIAVVDDVMTSGATLDAAAGALKRAGARQVMNWVVARTPPPGE